MKIKTQKITNRKFNKRVYIEMNNIIIIKKKIWSSILYHAFILFMHSYTYT
jgi:hypothetical protein